MRIARLIASSCYLGFAPIVPGTFGSMGGLFLYFILLAVPYWWVYVTVVTILVLLGIWAAGKAERESGIVDPSFVVIDEVAGQLITLFLIPLSWVNVAAGFILFRLLDIVKPFPARQAESLPRGWGIMMDDVIAGIYGNLLMHLGIYLWNKW